MKVRAHRLKLIERLINEKFITNQEQLQLLLEQEGFSVTQATLSRDLHHLKAHRAISSSGKSRYVLPKEDYKNMDNEAKKDIARGCLSMDISANIVVFRTPGGFANTFSVAFERLALVEVIGVVAGDDTVIAILKEGVTSKDFRDIILERVPDLKIKNY